MCPYHLMLVGYNAILIGCELHYIQKTEVGIEIVTLIGSDIDIGLDIAFNL